ALLGKSGSASGALNPEQRALVDRVNNYLSNMQVLSGNFVQVGPDGRRTEGEFYISKPGKVRFEYDDPSPIELIADGQSVVVRDRKLATQDVYPLSQTPLRFLLSDHVDLMKDATLTAVYADDVFITVVVEEKNGLIGTSRLMMMFSAKDMALKQWTVTDPQGYDTTVAVYNLDSTRRPDPAMFRIDYTQYRN
ncbi:MAG: outer membrane lipoprotein carrier protein LolA, partial [Pseudolabrys sp.]